MDHAHIKALLEGVVPELKAAIAVATAPLLARVEALEARSLTKGDKGDAGEAGLAGKDGADGIDGKDGAAGRDGVDGTPGERGRDGADGKDGAPGEPGPPGPAGRDGADGRPGERGADGKDGLPGLAGKDGAPGRDGKDADPDLIKSIVDDVVRSVTLVEIPKSFMINEVGALVAAYADGRLVSVGKVRGEDGPRGASVMDGSVDDEGALILRMSDGRHVNVGRVQGEKGIDGSDGERGRPGRDAHELQVLPGIDEARSYLEGVCARWKGGLIRADRETDPVMDGNIKAAGWSVILNGIASEEEHTLDDGRMIERITTYTDGTLLKRSHETKQIIYRKVWKEGRYQKGDCVTFGGSAFVALNDTTEKPELGKDWCLAVKRGRDGRDGREGKAGPQGAEGKPGRVY